ncbi:hypothetical protein CLV95_10437 [Leptospira borgpetersenii serovar Javanica]|nr:hypothetical protein CLV95_10437 [Leptospira borgpetersenii serovar Javanica]
MTGSAGLFLFWFLPLALENSAGYIFRDFRSIAPAISLLVIKIYIT